MAKRGRRAAEASGLLLVGLLLVGALQWRPLVRAWYVGEMRHDHRKLLEYYAYDGSIHREAALEFLTSAEGGAAGLDVCFGPIHEFLEPGARNSLSDSAFVNVSDLGLGESAPPVLDWLEESSDGFKPPVTRRRAESYIENGEYSYQLIAALPKGQLLFPKAFPAWKAIVVDKGGQVSIRFTPR